MQKPVASLMVALLLFGLFLMRESRQGAGARIEAAYGDWIATNTSRNMPPSRVALAEINDSSLASEHAWPWSPLEYALFFRAALPFKPDVVAIEPVLDWQGAPSSAESRQKMEQFRGALHDCILQTPKLVLGSELGDPDNYSDTTPPLVPVPLLRNVTGDKRMIPQFTDVTAQPEEDFRLSATVGFTNIPPPNHGEIIREVPLVFNYRGEIVPSFVLQTLMRWFKLTPDQVQVEAGTRGSRIMLGKAAIIPTDAGGRMNVDFSSTFTRFSEDDLLLAVSEKSRSGGNGKNPPAVPTDALKGSIVILARTDTASHTLPTASRSMISQGELTAAAIATVLNNAYTHRASALFEFAVIALMMALGCFFHRFRKRAFALISFVALLCYFFLCMSVYAIALVRMPFILPAGLLLLMNFFSLLSPRDIHAAAAPLQQPS